MRIGVFSEHASIGKVATGAIAQGLAFLGHSVHVCSPSAREQQLSFFFPTLNITECDATALNECKVIITDTVLPHDVITYNKHIFFIAEALRSEHVWWLCNATRGSITIVCTQKFAYDVARNLVLRAVWLPLGADDTVSLIHPQNCFHKMEWVISYDCDNFNCLPTTNLARQIIYEITSARYFVISHRLYERLDGHQLYKRAAKYDKEAHNIAPLPLIANSRVLVIESPYSSAPPDYFPYRVYHTAVALNTWVVAVGYTNLNLHGVVTAHTHDEAVDKIKELCAPNAPLPFATEDELIEFRNNKRMSALLNQYLPLPSVGEVFANV